ncbi:MAG: hypothetical protein LUG94_02940 [Ruminococcus sp.]|nr:hypothetical protein [Ruminococcus sp.]
MKDFKKIIACIMAVTTLGSLTYINAGAVSYETSIVDSSNDGYELSSISIKSDTKEYTVPLGYKFTLEDIDNLTITKTYCKTWENLSGGTEYSYKSENVSIEDLSDYELVTKYQKLYSSEGYEFVVTLEYIGEGEEESFLMNSLLVKVIYDINDLSYYGDRVLTDNTILSVEDGDYSKDYLFDGSENLKDIDSNMKDIPTIKVTEDVSEFLLDCDAFYVKATYSYNTHTWTYGESIILKEDTITTTIDGYISDIDQNNNTFTVTTYDMKDITYTIDADYVYIPEDIDITNLVHIIGYNVSTENWYTNPYRVFVEPSYKVTLNGVVTSVENGKAIVKFDNSWSYELLISANVGDTVIATNYGDCIDDDWFNSATIQIASNTEDVTLGDSGEEQSIIAFTIGDSVYPRGDINLDGKANTADLLYLKKYLLGLIEW